MSSESKRIEYDNSLISIDAVTSNTSSLLPENVQYILQSGLREKYQYDTLSLHFK